MASEFTFGAIPAFYREVYEIVCPNNQEHVDHDMFLQLLVKSSLPKSTLSQIWDTVDSKQGYLTRTGLYKALALTALAQQGSNVNEKLLESFHDQELPKPQLGDLTDLKSHSMKVRRERTPNILGFNYAELCDLDLIKLEVIPEKKGLILKHVEYEVTSQKYSSTVLRRYNDFVALHEVLLLRFPYRMVPQLPPKKLMGADRDFIEQRRRALRRFMVLVVRHPVLTDDAIVRYFLTFKGSDLQHKIRDCFKGTPDEFMTNENAFKAKELVPLDTQTQFSNSRELMRLLYSCVSHLKEAGERIASRASDYASDMLLIGKELSNLGNCVTPVSPWATGTSDTWSQLRQGFKKIATEFASLADKSCTQATREEDRVVEILSLFLDLLQSYQDLCERHEKGVLTDHQRALHKMGQYKKKKMQAAVQNTAESGSTVEQLEQRILQQESEISNMENRNYFSLHCVQMETQLIHANMVALHEALENLAAEESKAHSELGDLWLAVKPLLSDILTEQTVNNNMRSPTKSPRTSPTPLI